MVPPCVNTWLGITPAEGEKNFSETLSFLSFHPFLHGFPLFQKTLFVRVFQKRGFGFQKKPSAMVLTPSWETIEYAAPVQICDSFPPPPLEMMPDEAKAARISIRPPSPPPVAVLWSASVGVSSAFWRCLRAASGCGRWGGGRPAREGPPRGLARGQGGSRGPGAPWPTLEATARGSPRNLHRGKIGDIC